MEEQGGASSSSSETAGSGPAPVRRVLLISAGASHSVALLYTLWYDNYKGGLVIVIGLGMIPMNSGKAVFVPKALIGIEDVPYLKLQPIFSGSWALKGYGLEAGLSILNDMASFHSVQGILRILRNRNRMQLGYKKIGKSSLKGRKRFLSKYLDSKMIDFDLEIGLKLYSHCSTSLVLAFLLPPLAIEFDTTGNVVCSWGRGEDGQLGLGDAEDRLSPIQLRALDGQDIVSVTSGADHTTAFSESSFPTARNHTSYVLKARLSLDLVGKDSQGPTGGVAHMAPCSVSEKEKKGETELILHCIVLNMLHSLHRKSYNQISPFHHAVLRQMVLLVRLVAITDNQQDEILVRMVKQLDGAISVEYADTPGVAVVIVEDPFQTLAQFKAGLWADMRRELLQQPPYIVENAFRVALDTEEYLKLSEYEKSWIPSRKGNRESKTSQHDVQEEANLKAEDAMLAIEVKIDKEVKKMDINNSSATGSVEEYILEAKETNTVQGTVINVPNRFGG
ncbi:hypothetical protein RJ639_034707 [Escallonia herrerae]|uniref:Uncharacterized protein n=1 Tax=Escallonia herrerae TaxID=1293975 RepID=A0AA88XB85_9ASTE|nr:hypothetical protein RJ639_034707 [Escallonia herrerae]